MVNGTVTVSAGIVRSARLSARMPPSGVGKNLVRLAMGTSPQEPIGRVAPARSDAAASIGEGHRRSPGTDVAPEGSRQTRETPHFGSGRRRGQVMRCTVLPTFLSKVRACTAGSATGLPPEGGSP